MNFDALANDEITSILSFCSIKSLGRMFQTCKRVLQIGEKEQLWKAVVQRKFSVITLHQSDSWKFVCRMLSGLYKLKISDDEYEYEGEEIYQSKSLVVKTILNDIRDNNGTIVADDTSKTPENIRKLLKSGCIRFWGKISLLRMVPCTPC